KEYSVQPRRRRGLDIGLLAQLANERIDHRLAWLDATTRKVPAAHVAVLDQKDAPLIIDHQCTCPQRETAGKPPIDVQDAPDERFQRIANPMERLHCQIFPPAIAKD